MKRRIAVLLTCALTAFGQRTSPPSAAAPNTLVLDAVALDTSGRPVADLTAEDFEIVQGGQARKITQFTWFDTRMHTSVSRVGQLPALDLLPDEIRRNLVVVVDDLGMTAEGITAVRAALMAFVESSMVSADRVAILRGSGGSGALQQLTGDKRTLGNAIAGIRYLGGSTSAASAGKACWMSLGYALDGLQAVPGRKIVVLFAENPASYGPFLRALSDVSLAANSAAAAVYVLDPRKDARGGAADAGVMGALARDTGGRLGGDFEQVLRNEQGYYAIGFETESDPGEFLGLPSKAPSALVKVRRPGVEVRSRTGFLKRPLRDEYPAPEEFAVLLSNALASPFAGPDIRTQLTAIFADSPAAGPVVDAGLHFDAGQVSFIQDLQGTYHGGVQVRVSAHALDGRSTRTMATVSNLTMRPAEYRAAMENGANVFFQVKLPGPGAWQIRAAVADNASDRLGSAAQFVDIPDIKQGTLAISGVILHAGTPAVSGTPEDPKEGAAVRIFKPGRNCAFFYSVFNAIIGPDKESMLEVQTRIFAEGRLVFQGEPRRVHFSELPLSGGRRPIGGSFKLEPNLSPGDYILEVTVRDMLAPAGQPPHTAVQFTTFQVRE